VQKLLTLKRDLYSVGLDEAKGLVLQPVLFKTVSNHLKEAMYTKVHLVSGVCVAWWCI
jgi:hypothetical protein